MSSNHNFKSFEISLLKNNYKYLHKFYLKRDKLQEKIYNLQKELDFYNRNIKKWEATIVDTFGYQSDKLVEMVVEDTGKLNKNGKPVYSTKYVLKYKTVIPPYAKSMRNNEQVVTRENK